MAGDENTQQAESGDALSDLVNALTPEDAEKPIADDSGEEGSEESEESEKNPEEREEGEEEESAPEKQAFTIKVDGKEIVLELTSDQIVAELQKAKDYTQKTMVVAEKDKAVEAKRQEADHLAAQNLAALNETVGRLRAFQTYAQSQLGEPPPIDMATYDAGGYIAQNAIYQQRWGQLQQAEQAIQQAEFEQQQICQAQLRKNASETIAALKNTLPGWNDNTLPELEKYVADLGLSLETAGEGYVHKGLWEMAAKAKAYDAIQSQKAQMKPVSRLQKVVKPGAANPPGKLAERAAREAAFNKNPSVNSLADLLVAR